MTRFQVYVRHPPHRIVAEKGRRARPPGLEQIYRIGMEPPASPNARSTSSSATTSQARCRISSAWSSMVGASHQISPATMTCGMSVEDKESGAWSNTASVGMCLMVCGICTLILLLYALGLMCLSSGDSDTLGPEPFLCRGMTTVLHMGTPESA